MGRGLGSQYPVSNYDYWSDTDYWRFEALAGDKVAIAVDTPASGLDPYLELRDANDSTVASENNGGPDSDDYLSYYSIPADGTYYVRVGDYYYNTTPGSYEVRVELARGIQLESDRNYNNNSFSNADVLTLQQGDAGHLLATVAGTVMAPESTTWDQDRYQLGTLTAGNQVALSLQLPADSSLVPRVRLLKADGTEVADEDGDPWDAHFLGTIADGQDGVYYAELSSYWSYGDHRYLVTDSMTWSQAQALAVSLGGNLVTINDAAEQQWVDDTFDQFGSFWLGLTDEASEGTWLWASGQEVTYTNWISGEPNTTSYDYAYMENGAGGWRDYSVTSTLRAVLEFDVAGIDGGGPGPFAQYVLDVNVMDLLPPVVTEITQTPSGDPATQPVDFFQITFNEDLAAATVNVSNPLVGYHNGRFYTVTPDTMTWTEAEAYAQSLDAGAHLATIHDAPTQAYLQQWYAHYSPWIGLTDQQSEGNWQWANAQEVTYTHWGPGEPNDTDSRADYALLGTDGLWYDDRSYSARRGLIDLGPIADSDGDQVPDMFDVYPSDPLNAWDVREAGADGQFDTPDDVLYSPYLTATYVSGTSVSLALRDGPLGTGHYRLTVERYDHRPTGQRLGRRWRSGGRHAVSLRV